MRSHPHLYEINTWPWLGFESTRAGRSLRLGGVPDDRWSRLRDCGIDIVYLMGIWTRSRIGREMALGESSLFAAYDDALPGWRPRDVVGSAYSIAEYAPDPRIGTWDDLAAVRRKLNDRGMCLVVDFVPNHTGFDHPWIAEHPDRFVTASEEAFRRSPSAFRAVELASGEVRFIAHGRDPFFPPWRDVAQLNYCNPDTRAGMLDTLRSIAVHADGARCDMAMLVLTDVFQRTWGALAGPAAPGEFWHDAAAAVPGFLLLAEVYWDLEWRLQRLGFQFTYDKRLYDRLLRGSAEDVRGHLAADTDYQRGSARFIENHDEPRSAVAFGERAEAAAVVMSTLQGLRFFYDGQFEGHRVRAPVQLGAVREEPVDQKLAPFYERLLAIVNAPVFHSGDWRLCDVRPCGDHWSGLVAWRWMSDDADTRAVRVVVVNLGAVAAEGLVDVIHSLPDGDDFVFEDLLDGQNYPWRRPDLAGGLFVRLAPWQAHVFSVTRPATRTARPRRRARRKPSRVSPPLRRRHRNPQSRYDRAR
jgi:hypothetical protein